MSCLVKATIERKPKPIEHALLGQANARLVLLLLYVHGGLPVR